MVTIDVRHDGLGRFARVTAPSKAMAEQRAAGFVARWDAAFERRKAILQNAGTDVAAALKKLDAEERTRDAEHRCAAITAILVDAVRTPPLPDWSALYDTTSFAEAAPIEPVEPIAEREPQPIEFKRAPLTLLTLINPRAMRRRKEAAVAKFKSAHDGWDYVRRWRESEYDKATKLFRLALDDWQNRRAAFLDLQQRANARIDALRDGFAKGEAQAVIGQCDLTLLSLERPEGFPAWWTMTFVQGALQIDYELPAMDHIPVVKAVKYVPSRDVFETVVHSERERERLYGEAVFQTCLAVMHALFTADTVGAVKTIAFNGWTNYIDRAAGHPGRACILSVTSDKRSLAAIDLASIDPVACFRSLNGTMSSKLAAITTRG